MERFSPTVVEAHLEACEAGSSTYLDPATGYQVMTARYLWERGYCCANGCRHCPYLPAHSGGQAVRPASWRDADG